MVNYKWNCKVCDCNVKNNDISIPGEGALFANEMNDFMIDSAPILVSNLPNMSYTNNILSNDKSMYLNQCYKVKC